MADQSVSITAVLIDKISGPGTAIRGFFQGLRQDFASVVGQSSGVTSALAAITASVFSLAAANKALTEAQLSVQTEQRLLGALRGRVDEFERLTELAADFQAKTTFNDEALLNSIILFVQAGKTGKELDKTLQAAVDTASALGVEIETVTRAILGFDNESSGRLSKLVPQLKDLETQGELSTKGVEKLLELFSGRGEDLGATAFGKSAIQANRFSDNLEKLGKKIIDIKVAFQTQLNNAVEEFIDFLDSPVVETFRKILIGIIDNLGGILPVVLAIGTALTGLSAAFAVIVGLAVTLSSISAIIAAGPVLVIAGKVLLIAGVVAAILAGVVAVGIKVLDIFGLLEPIKKFTGGLLDDVNRLFKAIAEGKISVEDIFDVVFTKIQNFATLFDAYIINPIARTIAGIIKIVLGAAQLLVTSLTVTVSDFIKFAIESGQKGLKAFAKLVDATTNLIADGFAKLPGVTKEVADQMRTNIEKAIPTEFTAFDKFIKQQKDGFDGALATFKDGFAEFGRIFTDIEKAQAEVDSNNIGLMQRILQRFLDRARAAAAVIEKEKQRVIQVANEIAALEQRLDDIRHKRNIEAQERERESRLKILDSEFDRQMISAKDFIAEKEKLERQPFETKLAQNKILIDAQQKVIDKVRAEKGAQADVRLELQALIELLLTQQKLEDELLAKNIDLLEIRRKISGTFLTEVENAEQALQKKAGLIAQQLKDGSLTPTGALNEAGKATEEFQQKLEDAKVAVRELLGDNPELNRDLDALLAKLNTFDNKEIDVRFTVAESLFDDLDDAKKRFDDFTRETQELLKRGLISVDEASKRTVSALSIFDTKIIETTGQIKKLADENPDAAKKFDVLFEKIRQFGALDFKTKLGLADTIKAEVEEAQSELRAIRLDTSNLLDTGRIFESEAIVRVNDALADFKPKLEEAIATIQIMIALNPELAASLQPILEKFQKIQQLEFSGPRDSWEDFTRGFSSGFGQVVKQFDDLSVAGQKFGSTVATEIGDGLVDALTDADFSFRNFAGNFLKTIAQMIAQMVIFRAISSLFFSPVPGAAEGGKAIELAGGGEVPGPSIERDIIPAMLMPEEWVIRKSAAQYYGDQIMAGINSRLFPRELFMSRQLPSYSGSIRSTKGFAEGGAAKTGFGALQQSAHVRASVVPDEQSWERQLAGGAPAMLDFIKKNKDTIKSLLD